MERFPPSGHNRKKGLDTLPAAVLKFAAMKKLFTLALLGMVSWALVGTPVQAKETSEPGMSLTKKHKKHHKKHKKKKS